ncbi:hypothetical protein B0H67DRAFT_123978 [Lasiosphaeris hirsuta]|uniref:Autophagy-related protein 28 n=1 Tax=Lasiosphaeris hirsuta TaxID=260670 RepID=A0AA40B062_9PEZI|nr:hypothetical protein B0H67DRAFT_123978 [Lasiosphaeris hirsuta]
MATNSSYLPRLSFGRVESPILPLHNQPNPSIRKKPSEYDMSELSPRPDDAFLSPKAMPARKPSSPSPRSPALSAGFSDQASHAGSASKLKPRVLFAGPPPPIADSRILYRDEEENHSTSPIRNLEASTFARNINSVIFDRVVPSHTRDQAQEYEPDTVWRGLQRRERALQKDLQLLLDAQSTGLAANLDPSAATAPSSSRSDASDAGSSTPTGTLYTAASTAGGTNRRLGHIAFEEPLRATPTGEIIPVRQPRKKPMGLRAARAGLARSIALLADLKAEEDATLAAALSTRKKALAQLRKLAARRDGIAEELRALEGEEEEPLTRELRELREEHGVVAREIAELEERLVGLRNRRRWLDGRIEDVRNRREAGLSGYKGALKEVEGRVEAILARPPVKPLDVDAIAGPPRTQVYEGDDREQTEQVVDQSPGGAEFLRMRPERRTIEMAKEWWESEVAILERRKGEVDKERFALEEGVEVWRAAIKIISDFEAGLRREMKSSGATDGSTEGKGKGNVLTPGQAMSAQLSKMGAVMSELDELLRIAEEKGWNLLICAIGAELAAFREAEAMLREALRAAGLDIDGDDDHHDDHDHREDDDDDDKATPQVGRSVANIRSSLDNLRSSLVMRSSVLHSGNGGIGGASPTSNHDLLELREEEAEAHESDNEVPAGLLVAAPEDHGSPVLSRDDSLSENEVPPEFLAQHHDDHV